MDPQTIHKRRWTILYVLVVCLLVIVLDNTVLNVALKTIADPGEGLGASQGQLEWAINSYTLVFAGLLFTFGVLGDRVGHRRMLIIGMVLFGLSSLVSSYAQTPGQLILARAAMGLGGAAVMPQTLSVIANVFEPEERGRAIGIWAGAVGVGIAIGPITGGLLLDHFWWGSVFLINVPVVAAGIVAIALVVPESRGRHMKIDFGGVLLSIAGLVLLTYGIIEGGEKASVTAAQVYGPIIAGLALLAVFVWYESRISHPSLNVRLFRDGRLSASVGAIALVFFALGGVVLFVSLYLQSVRGFSPLEAGALSLPLAVGQLLVSPRSATLVGRYGARAVAATGLVLVAFALLSYHVTATVDSPIWLLEITFFIQGAGMGMVMPPATTAVMSVLPREQAGSGSAINNIARQVAIALGVAVLGSLVTSIYRSGMKPHLTALPEKLRETAGESIGATAGVADHLGPAGRLIMDPAHHSFVHAMHVTSAISSAVALLGALVVLRWMPGKRSGETPAPSVEQRETAEV
ncbi:MFS transporter [Actinomadura sp. DC4]|uniref:MFS transporter n=1 Tax=Actinomadura sp. DC4 TaxID=3055069 RepID=UPI0025B20ACB|nr:MFS transporter [Actinomadura sp. DC4]MDN3353284.1 MFS transporter [Actinomadura sp. DC4]